MAPATKLDFGEVAEWSNATVLKTVEPSRFRGFESHPLRQFIIRYKHNSRIMHNAEVVC